MLRNMPSHKAEGFTSTVRDSNTEVTFPRDHGILMFFNLQLFSHNLVDKAISDKGLHPYPAFLIAVDDCTQHHQNCAKRAACSCQALDHLGPVGPVRSGKGVL
jgi:hypothetical protein